MANTHLSSGAEQAHPLTGMEPVEPVKPAAPYYGGKKRLARTIIEQIDCIPHRCYAEPFVGMGGVFLRRPQKPRAEVVNDFNGDVATFFRILQRHYVQFMDMLKFQVTSRREFERLSATDPETLTDLERAARFLYMQRAAYGGKVTGQAFGVAAGGVPARFNLTKLGPMLEDLHERLSGVVIECLPYHAFIARYDHTDTLFYLDPPYWGTEDYYGKDLFARSDFKRLAEQLGAIKGRFILSLNDTPDVRRLFASFFIEEVPVTYTTQQDGVKRTHELLISN